jgi:exosortase
MHNKTAKTKHTLTKRLYLKILTHNNSFQSTTQNTHANKGNVMTKILNFLNIRKLPPHLRQLSNLGNLTLTLKILTMATATLALYYQDLAMITQDALQSEITNYMLTILPILAYLIYRKKKMLRAVIPIENQNYPKETKHLPTIAGILLCTAAITFYWYGSYTFTPLEHHMATLPIFVAGLTLILFNPQTLRQIAFPIAFLFFLTPPPAEILYALGSTLSVMSSEASHNIVKAFGIPSTLSGEYGNPTIIITRPDGSVMPFAVDIACAGIYSLIGFLIFATFIAYITRDKTWKKATIFLIGLPLIYALNIVRITIILLIGYYYGEQPALQIFHLLGGWTLIFLGTLLLLTITEKAFKTNLFTKTQSAQPCEKCNPAQNQNEDYCPYCGRLIKYPKINPKKQDIAKIATIALVVALLLTIQAPVFALTEGPAQITIQTPTGEQGNTQILPQIQGYTLQFVYRDKTFEQTAKQDASLVYAYIPTDKTKPDIYIAVEIATTTSSLHRWETCLITWPQTHGYQPKVTQLELKDIQILQNPPIIARYFAFQYTKTNQTQIVLYWYETATFTTNNTAQQKHVKISLIAYPNAPQEIPTTENQLLPVAEAVANYWQPIKTWTQIALTISQNGPALTATTATLLAITLAFQIFESRKERKSILRLYNKLAFQDKLILRAVAQASRKGKPVTKAIASQLQTVIGKNIHMEQLEERLREAERVGLTKRNITNQQDEPKVAWKLTFNLSGKLV